MIHVNQSNESAAFQGFLCLLSPPDFDIMAGRHQNRSYPLPGVHSSGQVHAFGNCTDSDILEEDAEVYELRSLHSHHYTLISLLLFRPLSL